MRPQSLKDLLDARAKHTLLCLDLSPCPDQLPSGYLKHTALEIALARYNRSVIDLVWRNLAAFRLRVEDYLPFEGLLAQTAAYIREHAPRTACLIDPGEILNQAFGSPKDYEQYLFDELMADGVILACGDQWGKALFSPGDRRVILTCRNLPKCKGNAFGRPLALAFCSAHEGEELANIRTYLGDDGLIVFPYPENDEDVPLLVQATRNSTGGGLLVTVPKETAHPALGDDPYAVAVIPGRLARMNTLVNPASVKGIDFGPGQVRDIL